ncbi:uncharacterized protein LAESUDRAFT_717201 [Laetiporus sulphureus 93-53]|uniref:Uncharacterized protein n=1 Tax=Laetiporus sulphureus 93-53 TaxID=1314785 RepID=A0A165BXY9_9APHY|nr:uncharacterized protein LAESUDRAFT_717201 [Laetiporus sulphureus 93-53]KZT01854.1 hypothetical protein LAESUDRAFT_717201 [Laetiporus sulphureus 93-53]
MTYPIAEAQLVALFMQSVTYGIHVVTFSLCMYTWYRRTGHSGAPRCGPWMVVPVALFVLGTVDVSFNLYHNLIAFIFYTGPGGAEAEFKQLSNWVNAIRSVWYVVSASVSDAALRMQRMVVTVLIVLWVGMAVSEVIELYYLFTLKAPSSIPDARKIQPYLDAFFCTSLSINILSTGMIVWRIWRIQRQKAKAFAQSFGSSGGLDLLNIIRIFLESALLYTLCVALTFIANFAGSNISYGFSDISVEIAGVSFDLIIIRIWKGVATEQTDQFASSLNWEASRGGATVDSTDPATTGSSTFTELNELTSHSRKNAVHFGSGDSLSDRLEDQKALPKVAHI